MRGRTGPPPSRRVGSHSHGCHTRHPQQAHQHRHDAVATSSDSSCAERHHGHRFRRRHNPAIRRGRLAPSRHSGTASLCARSPNPAAMGAACRVWGPCAAGRAEAVAGDVAGDDILVAGGVVGVGGGVCGVGGGGTGSDPHPGAPRTPRRRPGGEAVALRMHLVSRRWSGLTC